MAPQVSLADDVERLSVCVAGLARVALAGKLASPQLGKAAAAAGLSAAEAGAFWRGEVTIPSRQSIALISAVLEQSRAQQVNYMETLRRGHAGSDVMSASYQARIPEKITLSRGRTEDRIWVKGGPLETSSEDVEATLTRLAEDFPGWKFECDGAESLVTDKPKLGWRAAHPGRGDLVLGATSFEVAGKVQNVEDRLAEDAEKLRRYNAGGVEGRRL